MCEFSVKLMAWIDGELAEGEGTAIEQHLAECGECRSRVAAYRRTSAAWDAYCDAAVEVATPETRPSMLRWVPVAAGAAVGMAAAAALLVALPGERLAPQPSRDAVSATARATAQSKAALPAPALDRAPASNRGALPATPSPAESGAGHLDREKPLGRDRVAAVKPAHRELATASAPARSADLAAPEPAIEIAIPSEAMFPPGAVPEGMSFVADVTLGADGSAERVRLQPRLVKFERGFTRP